MLDTINIVSSAIIAAMSFAILAGIQHKEVPRHIRAALIFWGAMFALILVNFLLKKYTEVFTHQAWIGTTVDSISNMALIMCAYSLHRGQEFRWNDKTIHAIYAATPAFFILMLVFGIFIQNENIVWKLFYISPSALVASFTLGFIAIAAYKEPLFSSLRWPIVIVFATYALIQIPGYVFTFVEPNTPEMKEAVKEGKHAIGIFSAAGKWALIALMAGLVLNIRDEKKHEQVVTITRLTLSVLSIGFLLLVLFYRIVKAMGVFT